MQNYFENLDEDRREVEALDEIIRWKSSEHKLEQSRTNRKKKNNWGNKIKYDPHVQAAINSLERGTFIKHLI